MAPTTRVPRSWADYSYASNDGGDDDDHQLVLLWQPRPARKYKSMEEIMRIAERVELGKDGDDGDGGGDGGDGGDGGGGFDQMVEEKSEGNEGGGDDGGGGDDDEYRKLVCQQCKKGNKEEEILLCDKCDTGYHLDCLRPILSRVPFGPWRCHKCDDEIRPRRPRIRSFSQTKIIDFFRIQKYSESEVNSTQAQDIRKRRKRSGTLVFHKKKRRLLPFMPSEDTARRLLQMGSLASALTAVKAEFSADLTYMPGMAPRSANQAKFENGGMQVLSKEDAETLECCKDMGKRGLCPPLRVVFDSREGYTVEADGPIKDMTLIAEYAGDVDYMKNREHDDCDSLMTLLSAKDPSKSLVVCPDKRGNIARFINGINNHLPESKKKQNLKCVRYDVNGECRVILVATRDIAKRERLYYDYNGHEQEYPTHNFI